MHEKFKNLRKECDELRKEDEIVDKIYQFATQKYDATNWEEGGDGWAATMTKDNTLYRLVSVLECAIKIKKSSSIEEHKTAISELYGLSAIAPGNDGEWSGVKIGVVTTLGITVVVAVITLTILVSPLFFFLAVGGIVAALVCIMTGCFDSKPVKGPERVGPSKELYELAFAVDKMDKKNPPKSKATPDEGKIENSYGSIYHSNPDVGSTLRNEKQSTEHQDLNSNNAKPNVS